MERNDENVTQPSRSVFPHPRVQRIVQSTDASHSKASHMAAAWRYALMPAREVAIESCYTIPGGSCRYESRVIFRSVREVRGWHSLD